MFLLLTQSHAPARPYVIFPFRGHNPSNAYLRYLSQQISAVPPSSSIDAPNQTLDKCSMQHGASRFASLVNQHSKSLPRKAQPRNIVITAYAARSQNTSPHQLLRNHFALRKGGGFTRRPANPPSTASTIIFPRRRYNNLDGPFLPFIFNSTAPHHGFGPRQRSA